MALYREQLQGQTLSPASRMKLRDWTEKWLNEYMVHLVRPETISNYRRECELHIYPYLGDCQVSKISTVRIQRMYNDLRESGRRHLVEHYGKGLTGTTVRGIHMLLHEIMEYALKEKMILSNPTKGTTIPKIDPTELMVLDEKQLKIFISAIQSNEQWRDFFYLEIMTGLRRGEICALKWSDFDIVERKLHVNRSVTPHGAIGKAKTCYSERVIKLPYSVHQVLVNRKTSAQSEWMFPQPKDLSKPITGESALRQLKVILKSSGLPNIRFHDLRHTFATHAVSAGIDPKTLSSILGHSKASFSLDRYTAFPFQISHETGYACFRRYLYQHMNMIRAHFCFDDRYFVPFAQFP